MITIQQNYDEDEASKLLAKIKKDKSKNFLNCPVSDPSGTFLEPFY
jgi:hypothetical protein